MRGMIAVYRRELAGYFHTPQAYVFLAIFLFAAGAFTFHIGRFFDGGQADLAVFFSFHPWLFLVFLPAVSMRLWSEEIRAGSGELLLTLPIPLWADVAGKFLAAWTVAGTALLLTAPMWLTVNYLGDPDNGAIFAAYLGSALMAGGYIAIGEACSALTANAVIAFVLAVFASFLFTAGGLPIVVETLSGRAPGGLVEAVTGLSVLDRFDSLRRGVIEARDIVYFASLIGLWLGLTGLFVSAKRGG